MEPVYVIGVGQTRFDRYDGTKGRPYRTVIELGSEAVAAALQDACIEPSQISICASGMVYTGHMQAPAQNILPLFGIFEIPVYNVKNACATGATAIDLVYRAIASGDHELGLVLGMEKLSERRGALPLGVGQDHEASLGMAMTGKYAMRALRHMHEYGTTMDQLAMTVVQSRENASMNPYAMFREKVTIEQVLQSRMVAYPLTLLQCCPSNDGAAAAILASERIARESPHPPVKLEISLITAGHSIPSPSQGSGPMEMGYDTLRKATKIALDRVGKSIKDMSFAEVHDAFSIGMLLSIEALEICSPGESGRMLEQGEFGLRGSFPVNPSGGLLSCGHPLGATGVRQLVDATKQLRNQAGPLQVKSPEYAILETLGGGVSGIGIAAASVIVVSNQAPW